METLPVRVSSVIFHQSLCEKSGQHLLTGETPSSWVPELTIYPLITRCMYTWGHEQAELLALWLWLWTGVLSVKSELRLEISFSRHTFKVSLCIWTKAPSTPFLTQTAQQGEKQELQGRHRVTGSANWERNQCFHEKTWKAWEQQLRREVHQELHCSADVCMYAHISNTY